MAQDHAKQDNTILTRIREIVEEAHTDFDKWKYRKVEMDYVVAIICKAYRDLLLQSSKEKANEIISSHGRLHAEFLKGIGVYLSF